MNPVRGLLVLEYSADRQIDFQMKWEELDREPSILSGCTFWSVGEGRMISDDAVLMRMDKLH